MFVKRNEQMGSDGGSNSTEEVSILLSNGNCPSALEYWTCSPL